MARKIVITSGKGGVGKTTVAANLAAALSKKGERVVLCDADFGLNNADLVTGVENLVVYDIVDAIEGRCRAKQALVRHPEYGNLYVLSSTHAAPERYVSPQSLRLILDGLSPTFDYIVIDCPAGIDDGFHRAVASADEAIVVTVPSLTSVRDADKVITLLKSYDLKKVSLIVNRVRGETLAAGKILSPAEIEELLKIPLVAVIPEDDGGITGAFTGESRAYKLLASTLRTDKRKLLDPAQKYRGVLGGIKRFLKGS